MYTASLDNISLQQLQGAGNECFNLPPLANEEGPVMFVIILPNVAGDIYLAVKQ